MYLKILALDLDGTLAENDQVAPETVHHLRMAKEAGFILILATGRRPERPGENGAVHRTVRSNRG